MRWPVVKTIWLREVRDQLRDRRTLFMIIVLPLLLYPGLGITMAQVLTLFGNQPVTVGIVDHELLATTSPAPESSRGRIEKLPPLVGKEGGFEPGLFRDDQASRALLRAAFGSRESLEAKLRQGEIQAYLVITPEFVASLKDGRPSLLYPRVLGRDPPPMPRNEASLADAVRVSVVLADDDRGQLAYDRLREVLRQWREEILKARMQALGAPHDQYHRPLYLMALPAKAERLWGKIFPFLVIMMSLTGALYPAIDTCAGEKERGTMETLLISPSSRAEIVTGKFLAVWVFSAATALLNLASLGFTAYQFSAMGEGIAAVSGGAEIGLEAPSPAAMAWCVVLLVPLAAFFSAVCLALAVYARSTKEGQYYLMPLTLVTMVLTFLSVLPGAELTPFNSLLPITGASLLLQALMSATSAEAVPWLYLAPVLLPLAAYCYLALHWAVQQFNREEVLFREAERLDLRLWLERLLREKRPLPSAGEAFACFCIVMGVRWLLSSHLSGWELSTQTAVTQLLAVAAPPVLMALLLTTRPLASLRLSWPRWSLAISERLRLGSAGGGFAWLVLSALLALALHGPLVSLVELIVSRFPLVEEHLRQMEHVVQALFNRQQSLGWQLLVLALLPATCEELAFRGFILTGFHQRMGATRAILVTSLLFAFAHLNAFQFLPTFVLGIVLGVIATRSGSLLPGMVFHFVHNGLLTARAHAALQGDEAPAYLRWVWSEGLHGGPVMTAGLAIAAAIMVGLVMLPVAGERRSARAA